MIKNGKYKKYIVEHSASIIDIENKIKREWNSLLYKSFTPTNFLTYEWVISWWLAYGDGKNINLLSVRDHNGRLIGIAPLYTHRSMFYKIPVKEMAFIGENSSDRQDFIVHRDHPDVYTAILDEIFKTVDFDIVRFEQVPKESPLLSAIGHCPNSENEIDTTLPYIRIDSGWNDYYRSLSKKFKRDLKHKYNVLNRSGEWDLLCINDPEEIRRYLPKMANIEIESQKGEKQYAFFANSDALLFMEKFLKSIGQNRWANLFLITLNGEVISYLLTFVFDNTVCAYNMAFSSQYYRMSPGKLILNEAVKAAHEDNRSEFDFLRGNTYIKSLWTSAARQNRRIVLFKPSLKASILRWSVFHARPLLKDLHAFIRLKFSGLKKSNS